MTLKKCFPRWNAQRTFTTSPTLNFPSYPWVKPFSSSVLVSVVSATSSSSKSKTVILELYMREHFASLTSSGLLTLSRFRTMKGVAVLLNAGAKNEFTIAVNERISAADRSVNRQDRNIMTAVYNKYRTCVSTAKLLRLLKKSFEKCATITKVRLDSLGLPPAITVSPLYDRLVWHRCYHVRAHVCLIPVQSIPPNYCFEQFASNEAFFCSDRFLPELQRKQEKRLFYFFIPARTCGI